MGVVLAQRKEDGRIYPIQFARRTMKKEERNYSACECEALDVVFYLKKFRAYLFTDMKFKFLTYHQSLKYDFRKKDVLERLDRWIDLLEEYYFEIEYRPVISNGTADYLSRIAIAVSDGVSEFVGADVEAQNLDGLERRLRSVGLYLLCSPFPQTDHKERRSINLTAKRFMLSDGKIFRRTQ